MWEDLRQGVTRKVWSLPDGTRADSVSPQPAGILSGSFNPLHVGHEELRDAAEQWLGGRVCFELSVVNADKPALPAEAIENRRRQFDTHPVCITNAPTFAQKSALFPETVFVVGADTAVRIVDARFYQSDEELMRTALDRIRQAECRFLVAGRLWNGQFRTRQQITIPSRFHDLFQMLPESAFRRDISSTELRGGSPD